MFSTKHLSGSSAALSLAVLLACACPLSTRAAPASWSSDVSGNWTDTTNWVPMVVPDATSDVLFNIGSSPYVVTLTNASTAHSLTVQGDNMTLALGANSLTVGGTLTLEGLGSGTGMLGITGSGGLFAGAEVIGNATAAIFTQTSGTNTVFGSLTMGAAASGLGAYNMSGTTSSLLVAGTEIVGNRGNAFFNQSSGTHTISNSLFIANFTGSTGTFNLTGSGILNVTGTEQVGDKGTGYFNQSGGTNTLVSSSLLIGQNVGAVGYYNLSGSGVLLVPGNVIVGNDSQSTGSFIQTGGTATLGKMDIGLRATSTGSYTLSGGTLSVAMFEAVGDGGVGVFTQTGGTNSSQVDVSNNTGAAGTYNLQGGTLTATTSLLVNINGTFSQTGGTLVIPAFSALVENGGLISLGGPQRIYSPPQLSLTGGTTVLTSDASKVLVTTSVSITGAGMLDLNNNVLIVNPTSNRAGVISMLLGLVNQARGGVANNWTGVGGITSSTVAAGDHVSTSGMGLAVADAGELPSITSVGSYRGEAVDGNSIIVVAAHVGDVTLDGRIDIADLNAVTSHWQMTGAIWSEGDTTGGVNGGPDGVVGIADLNAVTSNWQFGTGGAVASVSPVGNGSSVPEPGSLALLVVGAGILLRCRSRGRL